MCTVFKPGSEILIDGLVVATISQVCIKPENSITYLCVWWQGNDRKEAWVNAYEVSSRQNNDSMTIGFKL